MRNYEAHLSTECGLTKAVRRVFEHKAIGETNPEIAELLFKSIKTIESQTADYLHKMDCKNTGEAVAKATAEGWLTFKHITKSFALILCINAVFYSLDDDTNNNALRVRLARSQVRTVRPAKGIIA